MALVILKESGSGLPNANTYAAAADGDAYHEGHLYAVAWTGAATAQKESALVMATRLIDGCYQFNGYKATISQALQWPRKLARDPDALSATALLGDSGRSGYFPSDAVPQAVVNATCEVARELIKADSTDATDGEGLESISIAGALSLRFDKKDQQATIPETARLFLAKLGTYLAGGSATVKLIRV